MDENTLAAYGRFKDRCSCYMCGYNFKVGDNYRRVYSNDTPAHGNPMVCQACDGEDAEVVARWTEKHAQFKEMAKSFWWFIDVYADHNKCHQ